MFMASILTFSILFFLLMISTHLLSFLLLIELMILTLVLLMSGNLMNWYVLFFFMIIAVCMSCFGVSLLVTNTQNSSNPYFLLF